MRHVRVALVAAASLCCARGGVAGSIPVPDHIVIVMEENHGYAEIIGSKNAPYINSLAAAGALFTKSYAVTHPSQPNYLELFSGSNQGVTDDSCPHTFYTKNEESQLRAQGLTFKGVSEELPANRSEGCTAGECARTHVPWTNLSVDHGKYIRPFTNFRGDYGKL